MWGFKIIFKTDTTTIDNIVFRLHYKATSTILLIFSIVVLCKQYFGVAIECLHHSELDMNTYCWIHSTFSLIDEWNKTVRQNIPYPGVGKSAPEEKKVYHAYYQWVGYVLFLQAILFYAPRHFWKSVEGGRIKNLVSGLNSNSSVLTEETKVLHCRILVKDLVLNMHCNKLYFIGYVTAEIMNFVNVIGQIFLMDAFLGGEFLTYGTKVTQFTEWKNYVSYDPMLRVFPRIAKCTFYIYGSSGDTQKHDAICILPINILNEKIYLFLWFWLIILAIFSGAVILYRTVIVVWPTSRFMVTRCRARRANQDYLETIISKYQIGDWLILDFLSKNLDNLTFRDVIKDLGRKCLDVELDDISSGDKLD